MCMARAFVAGMKDLASPVSVGDGCGGRRVGWGCAWGLCGWMDGWMDGLMDGLYWIGLDCIECGIYGVCSYVRPCPYVGPIVRMSDQMTECLFVRSFIGTCTGMRLCPTWRI